MMHGGRSILILPTDLPRLQLSDLAGIIRAGRPTPAVVIAPCHRLNGTNALLLRPPDLIPFAFGPDSYANHQRAARENGLEPVIFYSPTLAFDLDLPEDLQRCNHEIGVG
jgi:2-phospho-L-lactate guanylyltransferase